MSSLNSVSEDVTRCFTLFNCDIKWKDKSCVPALFFNTKIVRPSVNLCSNQLLIQYHVWDCKWDFLMLSFNGLPCWQSGDFMIIMCKNAQHLSLHVFSILSIGCHLTLKTPNVYMYTHTHILVLYFPERVKTCWKN